MPLALGLDYASVDDNAKPNWSLAKQPSSDGSTLQFVIMRAAYGDWIDTTYLRDFASIKAANLTRGCYLYPVYKTNKGRLVTVQQNAQGLISALEQGGYEPGVDLPPAIDIESAGSPTAFGVTPANALYWYEQIWEIVDKYLGIAPLIYTSARVWTEDMHDLMTPMAAASPAWLAKPWPWAVRTPAQRAVSQAFANGHYDPTVPVPWGGGNWWIHQYQGDAIQFPGFTSTVDINRFRYSTVGEKGPRVRWIQQRVGTPIDGIFGPATKTAVQKFQASHGLVTDGIVGIKTFTKLCWVK